MNNEKSVALALLIQIQLWEIAVGMTLSYWNQNSNRAISMPE